MSARLRFGRYQGQSSLVPCGGSTVLFSRCPCKLIFCGVLNRLELMTSEPRRAPMSKPPTDMFDPKDFLEKVGAGKAILEFHKNQKVFEQGDGADTVFYIQKGRAQLLACTQQGRTT